MESPSRYLHLTASPHIWVCENFGIKDRKIRPSIWIATHFLQQRKMHFTWTSNSAGGIWFPVKTHKWRCVPCLGWLRRCHVPGGLAGPDNGAQWMTQLTLQQKPAFDRMNHSLGSFPVLPRLLLILKAQLTRILVVNRKLYPSLDICTIMHTTTRYMHSYK